MVSLARMKPSTFCGEVECYAQQIMNVPLTLQTWLLILCAHRWRWLQRSRFGGTTSILRGATTRGG